MSATPDVASVIGPILFWIANLLLAVVGVVALVAAGRAPAMRVLVRVAGGLLILHSAMSLVNFLTAGAIMEASPVLGYVWNFVSVAVMVGAMVLLIIAVAFGATSRPGTATPPPGPAPTPPRY